MDNIKLFIHRHLRFIVQVFSAIASNAYLSGFVSGKIYQGGSKALCVPGLNCYACPGALGSCPIGSLQAVIGAKDRFFSWYVGGFLVTVGALSGRVTCGWLCPFGLLQDLIYRIPLPKPLRKRRSLPFEALLSFLRYPILILFVIILPIFVVDIIGQGSPTFCSWICPSGTLSGLILLIQNPLLRGAVGYLFAWKNVILGIIVISSLILYRPFCRYICPLGAIYGLFNPIALYRFTIDTHACNSCKRCQKSCKLDIPVYKKPNSSSCIRCGACISACPHHAIVHTLRTATTRASSQSESGCPS